MSDESADGERSRHDPRDVRMTTASSPSLRTDPRLFGLAVAVLLGLVAASMHLSADYGRLSAGLLFLLAVLVGLVSIPFGRFRGA